jgi:hypothetical protein
LGMEAQNGFDKGGLSRGESSHECSKRLRKLAGCR